MVELLGLQKKKHKTLPHHSTLEVYDKTKIQPDEFLEADEQRRFRSGLGIALYIAQDRPDIQQALKVLSTYMAGGTHLAMVALKHLGCYLAGTADYGVLLPNTEPYTLCCDLWQRTAWENRQDRSVYNVEGHADANWAGCKVTRRSTTSYMIKLNGCLLISSCKLQTTVAMSSAESELYAAASCAAEMIQVGTLLKFLVMDSQDFGSKEQKVRLKLYSDSSSARSISQRMGQGKLKHVDIRYLWIQEMVKRKVFTVHRVGTVHNIADLNTKKLSMARRKFLMSLIPMAVGSENGDFEVITDDSEVDKKKILRVMRSLVEFACVMGLQGCEATNGCENPRFLYGIMSFLVVVIVILVCLLKENLDSTRRFRLASAEVRRLLRRRQCPTSEESSPVAAEVEEACVEWFGKRDGEFESSEESELEQDPRTIQPTRDLFGTEEEWEAYCAAARRRSNTPRRSSADASAGLPLSARDENTFGAYDENEITNLAPHLREQAVAFLEKIPEDADAFYQFRHMAIRHDEGPECWLTSQAAFVARRIGDVRSIGQLLLARDYENVHVDLLRRLELCRTPDGYAEQYLWMLKESETINEAYHAFNERMQEGLNSTASDGQAVSQPSQEPNEADGDERPTRYDGTLSECSDPDGWIHMNYPESDSEDGAPDPAVCGQDHAAGRSAVADAEAAANAAAASESMESRNVGTAETAVPKAGC